MSNKESEEKGNLRLAGRAEFTEDSAMRTADAQAARSAAGAEGGARHKPEQAQRKRRGRPVREHTDNRPRRRRQAESTSRAPEGSKAAARNNTGLS